MTKETLMQLADDYYQNPYREGTDNSLKYIKKARQALSDAIDAALAQARSDALEEAAKVCDFLELIILEGFATRYSNNKDCAKFIRALKEPQ